MASPENSPCTGQNVEIDFKVLQFLQQVERLSVLKRKQQIFPSRKCFRKAAKSSLRIVAHRAARCHLGDLFMDLQHFCLYVHFAADSGYSEDSYRFKAAAEKMPRKIENRRSFKPLEGGKFKPIINSIVECLAACNLTRHTQTQTMDPSLMSPFSMGTTPLHHPDEELASFSTQNQTNVYHNIMNPPKQMATSYGAPPSLMMSQPPTPVSPRDPADC